MTTKHTPGPWIVINKGGPREVKPEQIQLSGKWRLSIGRMVTEMSAKIIANVFGNTPDECEANAKLIEATPELLDFCIKFEKAVFPNMPEGGESLLSLFQGLAKEVIAKATNQKEEAI